MSRYWAALPALAVLGCAAGSDLKTHYLNIDNKTLAYEVVLLPGSMHQMRIWRSGVVMLPDAAFERALQMRGAEKAMAEVCKDSAIPKIVAVKLRTPHKVFTDIVFRCTPKPKKKKRARAV